MTEREHTRRDGRPAPAPAPGGFASRARSRFNAGSRLAAATRQGAGPISVARTPTSPGGSAPRRDIEVSQPGDPLEREAERVADEVMRMQAPPGPGASTAAAPDEPGGGPRSAPAPAAGKAGVVPPGGRALADTERAFFEPRLDADLSQVRVHTDRDSAESLQAKAYTLGNDVVFAPSAYSPGSAAGQHLMAHVVQQDGARTDIHRQEDSGPPSPETEIASQFLEMQEEQSDAGVLSRLPPGAAAALLGANVSVGFVSGLLAGLEKTVDVDSDEFQKFIDGFGDLEQVAAFYGGLQVGQVIGLYHGVEKNVEGLIELAKLVISAFEALPLRYRLAIPIPPLFLSLLAIDLYELATDPEISIDLSKLVSNLRQALEEILEVMQDPAPYLVAGGEMLGMAVGEAAGSFFKSGIVHERSWYQKGVNIGDVFGQIALEVILLFIVPEALVLKGLAWVRRGASLLKGSRFVRYLASKLPRIRKLFASLREFLRKAFRGRKVAPRPGRRAAHAPSGSSPNVAQAEGEYSRVVGKQTEAPDLPTATEATSGPHVTGQPTSATNVDELFDEIRVELDLSPSRPVEANWELVGNWNDRSIRGAAYRLIFGSDSLPINTRGRTLVSVHHIIEKIRGQGRNTRRNLLPILEQAHNKVSGIYSSKLTMRMPNGQYRNGRLRDLLAQFDEETRRGIGYKVLFEQISESDEEAMRLLMRQIGMQTLD